MNNPDGGDSFDKGLDDAANPSKLVDVPDAYEKGPTFSPANVSGNTIDLGTTGHGLQTGDAVAYSKGDAGNAAIGGLTDGETNYVIVDPNNAQLVQLTATKSEAQSGMNPIPLGAGGTGSDHRLDSLLSGSNSQTERIHLNKAPSGTVAGAKNETDPPKISSGTVAFIGNNAEMITGNNVNVSAKEQLDFEVHVGAISVGVFAGLGGSVALINVNGVAEAYLGGTVQAGGDVDVRAVTTKSTSLGLAKT